MLSKILLDGLPKTLRTPGMKFRILPNFMFLQWGIRIPKSPFSNKISFYYLFILAVLGFESRALHLLGRHSTTSSIKFLLKASFTIKFSLLANFRNADYSRKTICYLIILR
jgi:hypothetical protein